MTGNVKFKLVASGKDVNKETGLKNRATMMHNKGLIKKAGIKAHVSKSPKLTISHDKIVKAIVDNLDQIEYDIILNFEQEKKAHIKGLYPDIIMTAKGTSQAKFILEVETSNGITKDTVLNKWKKYVDKINATPCIVVPEATAFRAKQLCQQVGVNARFATYCVDDFGKVSFNFK